MSEQQVAIVTGASSGIGMETALAFARRGWAVVPAARRLDRLEEVAQRCRQAGGLAIPVAVDVTSREQVENLVARAHSKFGRIDVMVNNAGYGIHARVHETTPEQMRSIFDVNFFGVFYGCRAVAPIMISQRSGHIFNVSSIIGKRGAPFNGAYSATKFAVCGLTDAMRVELQPHNVRVTSVCPALTDTEFFDHVDGGTSRGRSSFVRFRGLTRPEVVARRIVRSTGRNVPELVFTAGGRLLTIIATLSPRLADRMMKLYHDSLLKDEQGPPAG